jgi:hypothetical protein
MADISEVDGHDQALREFHDVEAAAMRAAFSHQVRDARDAVHDRAARD